MSPVPPGRLSPRINPDVVMMICTAGHVDHGKTSLVKLLTGCNTDRLKTEQERGMTIELGFAPCLLGGNLCVGIVDVPGHEKFIKNMVAGVSGIGMALLIIAADDGIMPQTIEHFQILDLLGVRKGMIALTKTDLVTPEIVQQRIGEIRTYFKDTFLDGVPICPVSSETFEGYPEFYNTLVERIQSLVARRKAGVFRMPIERVFTQAGFGAILSGIPIDGTVTIGMEVEVVPGGQKGKVRGIQRFLREATEGSTGQCLALNIPDLGKSAPKRGEVLCQPGYLRPARFFHVHVRAVSDVDPPLRNAESIKFHTGTAEASGKIYLLEEAGIAAGATGLLTVAVPEPIAAAPHDRCILRRPSPAATVAGGEILCITYEEQRPRKAAILERLKAYQAAFEGVDLDSQEGHDRRIEYFIRWETKGGAGSRDISRAALLPADTVKESLARLVPAGRLLALGAASEGAPGDYYTHCETYETRLAEAAAHIKAEGERKTLSLTTGDLQRRFGWDAPLWSRVLADLEKRELVVRYSSRLVLQNAVQAMPEADRDLLRKILRIYEKTGFQSPRPEELPAKLGAPAPKVNALLNHLYTTNQLIRLDKNVVLHYNHFKSAQDLVVQTILQRGGLDSAEFKNQLETSRKYAITFLDYLDSKRITIRVGNLRKLMTGYEERLL